MEQIVLEVSSVHVATRVSPRAVAITLVVLEVAFIALALIVFPLAFAIFLVVFPLSSVGFALRFLIKGSCSLQLIVDEVSCV